MQSTDRHLLPVIPPPRHSTGNQPNDMYHIKDHQGYSMDDMHHINNYDWENQEFTVKPSLHSNESETSEYAQPQNQLQEEDYSNDDYGHADY